MANSVYFGLHVGNTGMCLSMYKVSGRGSIRSIKYPFILCSLFQDGNVNVIANDIGDRITPAVLSVMHAEEILVGVPGKLNIVRNRAATVVNNKQYFEPNLSENTFDELSTTW